jgi:hypothetical protein
MIKPIRKKCPKCGKLARKERSLTTMKGRDGKLHSWEVFVHREEWTMGFHLVHECCYIEKLPKNPATIKVNP